MTITTPPPAVVTMATFDGQSISLTAPSPGGCNVAGDGLAFTISSTKGASGKKKKRSHGSAQLRFVEAEFFIDGGVKATGTRERHHKKVHYTYFAPNQIARQNPRTDSLAISGLSSGTHALKVTFVYKRGRKMVTKTLSTTFTVCYRAAVCRGRELVRETRLTHGFFSASTRCLARRRENRLTSNAQAEPSVKAMRSGAGLST
jgi:hypothetical protein